MRYLGICWVGWLVCCPVFAQESGRWKAGVAAEVITPKKHLWMAGYASRKKPAEGKINDLHAKALAFEDAEGRRLVVVTLDLIGISRSLRDQVARLAGEKYRLAPGQLLFNASHTHSGPVVRGRPSVSYDLSGEQWDDIEEYIRDLESVLVRLIGRSLGDLQPARIGYSHARAGFAMNRRLPTAKGYQNSPNPEGPVDHQVPILRVEDPQGKLRAVLFGYACHNTTLALQHYSGDYAGFAQEAIQEAHPGAVALFLTGCAGDQNPYPRGTVENAKQHGRSLASAVEAALLPQPQPISGKLSAVLDDIALQFVPLSREELLKLSQSSDALEVRRAKYLLSELEKNGKLNATYTYPVQVVQFGKTLTLVALAGEVVVDYSVRLQKELAGNPVWVAAYSNDVFGYVPSVRVLKEGGYEGGGAMRFTSHPGPFADSVEERIVGKVRTLVDQVRGQ